MSEEEQAGNEKSPTSEEKEAENPTQGVEEAGESARKVVELDGDEDVEVQIEKQKQKNRLAALKAGQAKIKAIEKAAEKTELDLQKQIDALKEPDLGWKNFFVIAKRPFIWVLSLGAFAVAISNILELQHAIQKTNTLEINTSLVNKIANLKEGKLFDPVLLANFGKSAIKPIISALEYNTPEGSENQKEDLIQALLRIATEENFFWEKSNKEIIRQELKLRVNLKTKWLNSHDPTDDRYNSYKFGLGNIKEALAKTNNQHQCLSSQ